MEAILQSGFSTWWTVKSVWDTKLSEIVKNLEGATYFLPNQRTELVPLVEESLANFNYGKINHRSIFESESVLMLSVMPEIKIVGIHNEAKVLEISTRTFQQKFGSMGKYIDCQYNLIVFDLLADILYGILEPGDILIVHGKIQDLSESGRNIQTIALNKIFSPNFSREDTVEIIRISLKEKGDFSLLEVIQPSQSRFGDRIKTIYVANDNFSKATHVAERTDEFDLTERLAAADKQVSIARNDFPHFPIPITKNMKAEQIFDLLIAPKPPPRSSSTPKKVSFNFQSSPTRASKHVQFNDEVFSAISAEKSRFSFSTDSSPKKSPMRLHDDDMPVFKTISPKNKRPPKSWFAEYKKWMKTQKNLIDSKTVQPTMNTINWTRRVLFCGLIFVAILTLFSSIVWTICVVPQNSVIGNNDITEITTVTIPKEECPYSFDDRNTNSVHMGSTMKDQFCYSESPSDKELEQSETMDDTEWPENLVNVTDQSEILLDCELICHEEDPCMIHYPKFNQLSLKIKKNLVDPCINLSCWVFTSLLGFKQILCHIVWEVVSKVEMFYIPLD